MDSATQKPPNPNPNPSSNVYHIGGLPVEFPYKPYGSQLAFMGRVISTLDRGQRQGHCHALLESPTGTGKSLSLLCSALAWQKNYRSKNMYANLAHSMPNPEAMNDPLGCGGGFVPDPEPSSNLEPGNLDSDPSAQNNGSKKKKPAPTIFYASRTHSQITQVIREYRKTSYRVPMAVLASRKHYCTNKRVCGKENIDEECKLLLKANKSPLKHQDVGCLEFKNAHKVKAHPSLQRGGCNEVHDIEDLVKVGQVVKGCSYFAARDMADEAQIVFCPYSYIINPVIRKAMEVDIRESIVILDEAHNIEDIARDAGSVDVDEDVLYTLQTELGQLCFNDSGIYQPLYDTVQGIISWIDLRKSTLEKREFQHYFSCWSGDKALRELQQVGISQQYFPILQECAAKAIKAAADRELDDAYLTGLSATTLEGLFSSLGYFFSGNGLHALDYQLALQRYIKKDDGQNSGGWTHSLSLWCLNPSVVFREIANLSMSVILTSGTLSPMSSFSSELGVQFETCMEAPHVIDVKSQLWAAVVSNGFGNYPLNASYKTADGYAFQDALGSSLEEICKVVPDGALVFFPSYKLMEKLSSRWRETGQWSRLNAQKSLFVEPRGNQDEFESVLKGYYDSVRQGNRPAPTKIKKGRKRDLNHFYARETQQHGGAAFLAVCRGKVSEGIDFSDENARVVVIVGIPFLNIYDVKVAQKKKYNDTYSASRNLLSGSQWYCHQAFRALNQAAGRCIRHRFDYGAIIFIDERFREERNVAFISKWLRNSIKQYESFDMSLEGLRSFFQDAKERFGQGNAIILEKSDIDEEAFASTEKKASSKIATERKTHKSCKADNPNRQKVVSMDKIRSERAGQRLLPKSLSSVRKAHATVPRSNTQEIVEPTEVINVDEYESRCSPQKDPRCAAPSLCLCADMDKRLHICCSFCKTSLGLPEHQYLVTCSLTSSSKAHLTYLLESGSESLPTGASESLPVVLSDLSSVTGLLYKRPLSNSTTKQGIWYEKDGFVFSTVYCPFCTVQNNILGFQIMATDSQNIQLLNKILFYYDCLEIKNLETSKAECCLPVRDSNLGQSVTGSVIRRVAHVSDLVVEEAPQAIADGAFTEDTSVLASTPKRIIRTSIYNLNSEMETPLSLGVNSHTQKRRKPVRSLTNCSQMDQFRTPDSQLTHVECTSRTSVSQDTNRKIEFELEADSCYSKQIGSQNLTTRRCAAPSLCLCADMDKRLHICCSFCKTSLGLPEHQYLVTCSLTSSSNAHLTYLLESGSESLPTGASESLPVVLSDLPSVTGLLYKRPLSNSATKQGIWYEKDGFVFRTVYCPFCTVQNNILGFQIMATDSQNIQLLNKILFYYDCLEIKNLETSKAECCLPVRDSNLGQSVTGSVISRVAHVSDLVVEEAPQAIADEAFTEDTSVLASTPKRIIRTSIYNLNPEMETPLSLGVNSHTQKRRKTVRSLTNCSQMDQFRTPDSQLTHVECTSRTSVSQDTNRRIEFEFEADSCYSKQIGSQNLTTRRCAAPSLCLCADMDKRLHICCSFCKTSLGLPEHQYLVTCSLTSSSKAHLTYLLESGSESLPTGASESLPVVLSDLSSVTGLLYKRPLSNSTTKQGIWYEKDGFVFSTVYCPFCTVQNNILGFQIMATDSQNIQLLNKILFYYDCLEIKNLETSKAECCLPVRDSNLGQSVTGSVINRVAHLSDPVVEEVSNVPIETFQYHSQQPNSGGWRTTRSKLRLPRRSQISET